MMESVFLYGEFDAGGRCYGRFRSLIQEQQPAYIKGTVYQLECGLRAVEPEEGGQLITGSLVQMELPPTGWSVLDTLNNFDPSVKTKNVFVRSDVRAYVGDEAFVEATAYVINPVKKKKLIALSPEMTLTEQEPTCVVDQLSEGQRDYIQRLSQLRGRETLPVNMTLYRELLTLELIVDKGRRIALTSLGQEVCAFL